MNARAVLAAGPLIALAVLTGCAAGDARPAAPAARHWEAAGTIAWVPDVHVLEDTTAEDYLAGFDAFASCMSAAGHPLYVHDRGVVLDWSYPYAGEVDGSFSRCYTTHFRDADVAWQLLNEYESETVQKLIACVTELGAASADDAEGVHRQVAELGIDPDACTRG